MKSLYLPEHDAFIRYFVIPGRGPVHVYLPPLICPSPATLLQVATHSRLAGRAALLVDYLGCGFSDRPPEFPHTMASHASTAATILDHERITGAVVVGHSMGGTVGLLLALSRPDLVSFLVLAESNLSPGGGDGTRRIAAVPGDDYVRDIVPAEISGLRQRARDGDDAAAALVAIRELTSDPLAVHAASRDLVDLDPGLLDRFLNMPVRSAFIYGERVLEAVQGRWAPDVPDPQILERHGIATFVVANSGHFMFLDNLDGYVDAVAAAIDGP